MKENKPTDIRRSLFLAMQINDLSVHGWSRAAGISYSSLRRFLLGDSNSMTTASIERLAMAVNLKTEQLISLSNSSIATLGTNYKELLFIVFNEAMSNNNLTHAGTPEDIVRFGIELIEKSDFGLRPIDKKVKNAFTQALDSTLKQHFPMSESENN